MTDFSSLDGRVVMVTGGAGHVGRAVGSRLLEVGAQVTVVDLEVEQMESRDRLDLPVDLGDLDEVAGLPETIVDHFGRLDVVVTAAAMVSHTAGDGAGWNVPFLSQDPALWSDALKVNLTSIFALVQAAAAPLATHGVGSVVLVSSQYGIVGPRPSLYEGTDLNNVACYAAGKAGVSQLARWLATTMAPAVRVNSVTPGGILRQQPEEFVRAYEELTPLGRMANEEDVVGPILFLASDLAQYVTGHDLVVDGGYTAW